MQAGQLEKINNGIRDKYVQVAKTPEGHFTYPTGRRGLEGLGYDADMIAGLPEQVASASGNGISGRVETSRFHRCGTCRRYRVQQLTQNQKRPGAGTQALGFLIRRIEIPAGFDYRHRFGTWRRFACRPGDGQRIGQCANTKRICLGLSPRRAGLTRRPIRFASSFTATLWP